MATAFANAIRAVEETIRAYPEQLRAGYRAGTNGASRITRPRAVVFTGMGGSHLAAHVFDTTRALPVPTIRSRTYTLPSWVDARTLVVGLSYSGTTEETVAALRAAKSKHASCVAVATGGTLAHITEGARGTFLRLPEETNPSGQPRLALPMMFGALVGYFHAVGLQRAPRAMVYAAAQNMDRHITRWMAAEKTGPRAAARRFIHAEFLIFASPQAGGIAHSFQNQCNETGKSTAHWHEIPESNHHLLEGLRYPSMRTRPMAALMLHFPGDSAKIHKRFAVTKDVLHKNHVKTLEVTPDATESISAAMELIAWASIFTLELARQHRQDPTAIPWVKYFKAQLKK